MGMGVIKLSKSGKQLQFICDEGVVYVTSVHYLLGMINKGNPAFIVTMNKLPLKVSKDRFPVSPVWNPEGLQEDVVNSDKTTQDPLSIKGRDNLQKVEGFKDKEVKW